MSADRIETVQALRAIAALAVVAQHVSVFGAGAWGVDVFFVISGFIVCYVTQVPDPQFLLKRLFRVVPLYWLGTLVVFVAALMIPAAFQFTKPTADALIKSMLFIPFEKGREVQPMLFLGWTLNYEMFFYLVFAAAMAISHRLRIAIASMLILALVAAGQLAPIDNVPLHFWTRPILLEFVFGMLTFVALRRAQPLTERLQGYAPLMLAAALVVPFGLSWLIESSERVLEWGLPSAIGFILLVASTRNCRIPAPILLLGDASYSLYLLHPYIVQPLNKLGGVLGSQSAAVAIGLLSVGLACALSIVSYKLIEKPSNRWLRRHFLKARLPSAEGVPHVDAVVR